MKGGNILKTLGMGHWELNSAWQMLYRLSHSASPFCVDYFLKKGLIFMPGAGLDYNWTPICVSPCSWDDMWIGATVCSYWLRWGLMSFCLGWSGTSILQISASCVVRIIGLRHSTWP
jgi:hypothetical protein